ncbi:hypothetical protein OPQ81_000680 [Rhizoctonia solani]|nr:hypothetical protein OPQ81_000680 [Rhizoctonia solani]
MVGEAKAQGHGKYQLASYLQNYLQLHPELNAALGFAFQSSGYALFYHDAAGPGQRRFTTTAVHHETNEQVFIKDVWRDNRRMFFEGLPFDKAHEQGPLPGLMWVYSHGFVPDEHGSPIWTTRLKPKSTEGWAGKRYKMRIITKDIGRPIEDVRSLHQFLCMMYDSCVVQRNLYRKCRILHRDISDGNIMIAPDTDEYRKRCAEGYAAVKFVNQVLAKCKDVQPNPACLVIDLGNGADLQVRHGQNTLTERTGTPKFIARSVACGRLLNPKEFESRTAEMPPMEGTLGDYSQFMHTTGYEILKASEAATQSQVKFAHQLFHDAESTFWVIAWALARSTGGGSEPEQGPHPYFRIFFHTMYGHYPEPEYDNRMNLGERSEEYWRSVLHPDLAILAPMLEQMFTYIRPEWAYRPELDPEHVHEALMRALLAEIVRIDETGTDIPIAIGGRAIPAVPGTMPPLSSSTMSSLS